VTGFLDTLAQRARRWARARDWDEGAVLLALGAVLGNQSAGGRVLSITRVNPRRSTVRVTGLANSGRYAYNPYGYGMYGAVGYAYQPDLSFRCDVDYRGRVRDIDINRRR